MDALRVFLVILCSPAMGIAQTIDFETLPDGTPTVDLQVISTEYSVSPFGVSFAVVDAGEAVVGFPRIAKVGAPETAFVGCPGSDEPLPGQGLGTSFLTDDATVGFSGNLLVTYTVPVSQASGRIIDIDWHPNPLPPTAEEWTITARDVLGGMIDQDILTAPVGPDQACTQTLGSGPGDGLALTWTVQSASSDIVSILIEYTGAATSVGLAFDGFSPSSTAGPPWTDLGGGTAGIAGKPKLTGAGTLVGGSPMSITLWNAPPNAPMLAWVSLAPTPFAALGGTVHSLPFASQLFFVADGFGSFTGSAAWPPGIPSGTSVWFQFLAEDLSTIPGLTLSNGLLATTP